MTKGRIVLITVALGLLMAGLWSIVHCAPFSACPWGKGKDPSPKLKKVALTFVGSWDENGYWEKIIEDFTEAEKKKRGLSVTVKYEQMDKYNYEDELLTRMVNRKTPNLFLLHNTWLPKYKQRIVEMPAGRMTLDQFKSTFPQVAQDDLVDDSKIYSLPMYIDTLALFYNRSMFANAGIVKAPQTWDEFAADVERLTIVGSDGKFQRLGAAVGGASDVNRSQDIVMLLVMQNNLKAQNRRTASLVSFTTAEANGAVKYYTDFADQKSKYYTWDYNDKTYSTDLFTQLKAAMEINYSYEIANIQDKTNGNLNYEVAPVPQQYPNDKVNYAYYWTPVVAKEADCIKDEGVTVKCSDLAWDFLTFAAQASEAEHYIEASGRPAANLELVAGQASQDGSKLAPFAQQVLTARSWENVDNEKNDGILVEMIDSIITTDRKKKTEVDDAMRAASNQIKELY